VLSAAVAGFRWPSGFGLEAQWRFDFIRGLAQGDKMIALLGRWLVLSIAVYLTTKIEFLGITSDPWESVIYVALFLGIANAVLRPILLLLSLPFVLLSLGLFIFVINAALFYFVGNMVTGFHVPSFASALGGSVVVSLVNLFFGPKKKNSRVEVKTSVNGMNVRPSPPPGKGPVIDI
jgi:putative membrane protein